MKKIFFSITLLIICWSAEASKILIPMDETQTDHLKAYGVTYWVLENTLECDWLLNYRGGSFLLPTRPEIEEKCLIFNVKYEIISDASVNTIFSQISRPDVNMDKIKLQKAPRIAVYAPKTYQPWDDAVMMVLTYAEIPYTVVYDEEVLKGDLSKFDWLHLHHEDFTGQYGKFWGAYRNASWYVQQVKDSEARAQKLGFNKVSLLKLAVAKTIKQYIFNGGFLFAMCSGTDSYDIALAAEGVDICAPMFDGDAMDAKAQTKLDYSKCLAFTNFRISMNPAEYEFSDIDATRTRPIRREEDDFFTLFDFSAKWDPVPTMLTQCHTRVLKGFMGQTTAFNKNVIKPSTVIMGELKVANEARYIHGEHGQGTWTFYGGHDPADYRHFVGDKPTELELHPNSAEYRLILNNILFPAAEKKKRKT